MATVKVNKETLSSVISDLNVLRGDLSSTLSDATSFVPSKVDLSAPPFKKTIYQQWDDELGDYVNLDTPLIKYKYRQEGKNFNAAIDAINPQLENIKNGLQYLDNVIDALNQIQNAVAEFESLDYSGDLAAYNFDFNGTKVSNEGVVQSPLVALKLAATAIAEANGWLDNPEDLVESESAFDNLQNYLLNLGLIEDDEDNSLTDMINAMGSLIKDYTSSEDVTEMEENNETVTFMSSLVGWLHEKKLEDFIEKKEDNALDETIYGEEEIEAENIASAGAFLSLVALSLQKLNQQEEKEEENPEDILSAVAAMGSAAGLAALQSNEIASSTEESVLNSAVNKKENVIVSAVNKKESKVLNTVTNASNNQAKQIVKEENHQVIQEQEEVVEDTKTETIVEEKTEDEVPVENVVEEIKIEVSNTADRLNSALQPEETADLEVDLPKVKDEITSSDTASDTVSSLIEDIGDEKVTTSAVAGIVGVGSVLGNNVTTPSVTPPSSGVSVGPVTYAETATPEAVAPKQTYSNSTATNTVTTNEDSGLSKGKTTYGTSTKTAQNTEQKNVNEGTAQSGMLGEASYVEMLAKEEKKYKIATATSLSATLLTLGLKYINVINWLSLLLLIIAIILVYTTYRARHKKKKKKLEALIRIEKEKSIFEREREKKKEMTLEEAVSTEVTNESVKEEIPEIQLATEEKQVEPSHKEENVLKVPVLPEQKEFQMAEEVIYGEVPKRTAENETTNDSEENEEKE